MFTTVFYNPVYNFVVFLLSYISDAGIVIILTTIIIKFILFPLYKKQIESQIATKKAKPELDAINKKYGKKITPEENKEKMMEIMGVYKKHKLNPMVMMISLIIQIPVLLSLYRIFYSGKLPEVDTEILYSFVSIPTDISMSFLNFFDLSEKSFFLAIVAGVIMFIHSKISMPDVKFSDLRTPKQGDLKENLMKDMGKSFMVNIKYGMPVFMVFLLTTVLNSAIALYFIASYSFQIIQELLVRKKKAELKNI